MTVVAATPTNVITGSTASISAGHATDVTLTGTIASGDLVIWTTGSCGSVTPNVDPTDGTNAVTSMTVASAGTYKLCVRKSGGSDSVEQSGFTMTVVAATPTNVITGSTASISAGHATDVTLTGTIASGDLVIWTTGSCGSVTPNVDPTDGTNA